MSAIVLALVSGIFLAAGIERRVKITSRIHDDRALEKLAEEAGNNQTVQRDLYHLTKSLGRDYQPGRLRHIEGTNVFYIGTDHGARLYFRKVGKGYEIVGKSAKGINQYKVIKQIQKDYSQK